jgi:3-oxoacyl-[acyl-carrier protein] reductase
MDTQLKGQRVLVTGGSKGIGYQIALTFAQEGAHPILVSRTQASFDEAAQRMEQATGIRPQVVAADLSDPAAPQALLQQVGEVDVLVNNAGAIPGGDIQQVDDAT